MIKPKPIANPNGLNGPLISVVANAIATADVDGATYEDLAAAAIVGHLRYERETTELLRAPQTKWDRNSDQEDDGA